MPPRDAPPSSPPRPKLARGASAGRALALAATLLLASVGVLAWDWLDRSKAAEFRTPLLRDLSLLAFALPCAALLAWRRGRVGAAHALRRVRRPTPHARRVTALIVGAGISATLLVLAVAQGWPFAPGWHDEHSYLLQARMLSEGHFSMPAHPVAAAFDTFHVIGEPRYASMYFLGLPLLVAPLLWAGLPYWLGPVLFGGAAAAAAYLLATRVSGGDGLAGLAVVALLAALLSFRTVTLMLLSHGAAVALGPAALVLACACRGRPAVAAALGVVGGLLLVTRPLDALAWLAPALVVVLVGLARRRAAPARWAATLAAGAATTALFVGLQLWHNAQVTGDAARFAYQLYVDRDMPGADFAGGRVDLTRRPLSPVPQKTQFYDVFVLPYVRALDEGQPWRAEASKRAALVLNNDLHRAWLAVPLAVGAWALLAKPGRRAVERWAVIAVAPLFFVLYARYAFFSWHYPVVVAPALLLPTALAGAPIGRALGGRSASCKVPVQLGLVAAGLVALLPAGGARPVPDAHARFSAEHEAFLAGRVRAPAVVLFRYPPPGAAPPDLPHLEPVYNTARAAIDDHAIVRAHLLGPEVTLALAEHYGRTQPGRTFWHFDRATGRLDALGDWTVAAEQARAAIERRAASATRPATAPAAR